MSSVADPVGVIVADPVGVIRGYNAPVPSPLLDASRDMRRSYIRVIVVWVITLAALYAFQEIFS